MTRSEVGFVHPNRQGSRRRTRKASAVALLAGLGLAAGVLAPSTTSAAPNDPFTFLAPGFTQELYGTGLPFAAGLAFAPDGDLMAAFGNLFRFESSTTVLMNGSSVHPLSTVGGGVALGLANGATGGLYANTGTGVVKIDDASGAVLAGPSLVAPTGNGLGIEVDPQTHDFVYGSSSGIGRVDATLTSGSSFSNAGSPDGIVWEPSGAFLFASVSGGVMVLNRSGVQVQFISLASGCCTDGMAFHAGSPQFLVSNNTDGTMTRFDFPAGDYTQPPAQTLFASGGFRGDLTVVGGDSCLYVTQGGTRFADGTTTSNGSVVKICPGFIPPVGQGGPKTKDDCKNDGWKQFTSPRTFKNQGDCIQFVNTGK